MCNLQGLPRVNSSVLNCRLQRSHDDHTDDDDDDIEHIVRASADHLNATASINDEVAAEPSSACLWAMVNDFLEMDSTPKTRNATISRAGSLLEDASAVSATEAATFLDMANQEMGSILESSVQIGEEAKISDCVATALKAEISVAGEESANTELVLPSVLGCLQREGYHAGLCVTERKLGRNNRSLPPTGGHRYIDVIMAEDQPGESSLAGKKPSERLIVDVGFSARFEIARPLPAYQKLIAMLPSTFIGKPELLQRVVRIMSQAARASLESQGMPIPPWRSFSFLHAKWFSSSRTRITSLEEASHVVLNGTSLYAGGRSKSRVLVERNCGSDPTNVMHPAGGWAACSSASKRFPSQAGDGTQLFWQPSIRRPSRDQIAVFSEDDRALDNNDDDETCALERKVQANGVSALALALAETRHAHMFPDCVASAVKAHSKPKPSVGAAVSVL